MRTAATTMFTRSTGWATFVSDTLGERPKNRLLRTPDGEPGLNYLCPGLKRLFAHAVPTAKSMSVRPRAESART